MELRQKEGHPSVRVFDRAVEDAQGRKTVGGLGWERKIWGDVVTFYGKDVKEYEGISRAREVVCLNWSLNPASVAWLKRFAKR